MESIDITDGTSAVEVVIEIPRGSFVKRGSRGQLDFISPFPCPFNYGSVTQYLGGDGDLLDAIVLGPRLERGARVRVVPRGAMKMSERNVCEDKLVCADANLSHRERRNVEKFMQLYARCKGLLNILRGKSGQSRCEGWDAASAAIGRARPLPAAR